MNQNSYFSEYLEAGNPVTAEANEIILKIKERFDKKDPVSETLILSELFRLLSLLFENCYNDFPEKKASDSDIKFTIEVSTFISENYFDYISSKDAAQALFMSTERFCRTFKKYFRMTFIDYLWQYRISKAIEISRTEDLPLSDVAARVGVYDYNYFSKAFKKYIGVSPSVYFKNNK